MTQRAKDLNEKRLKLIADARAILDQADKENRKRTAEERERFDTMMSEANGLQKEIGDELRLAEEERELNTIQEPIAARQDEPVDGAGNGPDEEKRAAFQKFLRGGVRLMPPEELRALQADSDTTGGYLQAPEQFVAGLIKAIDNRLFIRQLADVQPVPNADSLGIVSLDADPADADWTSEIGTAPEDSTMSFGKRNLHPHPLKKLIKVSEKLLRSRPDVEALVRERLAYKFAVPQEKGFLTGTGARQPLGVFTASDMGVSTSRDWSTGNTTTSMKFDGLIKAKYQLRTEYHKSAAWAFHSDGMSQIATLKDGVGQYMLRESLRAGEPDKLLGMPIYTSAYVPNTFTTGLYVGILADWKAGYIIADALNMRVQRLDELYAETSRIGFIGQAEVDGMPVLEEAFVRVKLA